MNLHDSILDTISTYEATPAEDFGEDTTSFVWHPYIPIGDYTVLMASGGTGKTYLVCRIAASLSKGIELPEDLKPDSPKKVLIISAEDTGELLKKRLQACDADLSKVFIIDRVASEGMNFTNGYDAFKATIKAYDPALVVIDPWHGFIGENADINKVNAVRPIFQKLANIAKECNCGMILVSHVNKRAQGENINNAATGSTDFINASRSALCLVFDEDDEDSRILVHTKSNYAKHGKSVRYRFGYNGAITWAGFSDIERSTLEEAARARKTPGELKKSKVLKDGTKELLIRALIDASNPQADVKFTYDAFKERYGGDIFGTYQAKRILDDVKSDMLAKGFDIVTNRQFKEGKVHKTGFVIHPTAQQSAQMRI